MGYSSLLALRVPYRSEWDLTWPRRGIGANVTSDEYDTYLTELETFRAWFDSTVMSLSYEQSGDAVLVLPCGTDGPKYRDSPPG